MADTVLSVAQRPDSAADSVPIKLVDNGDGTYSLSVATSGDAGPAIALGDGAMVSTFDHGDGTYAIAIASSGTLGSVWYARPADRADSAPIAIYDSGALAVAEV